MNGFLATPDGAKGVLDAETRVGRTALDLAATESVHAGLALYVALVETNVTVEASLAASRRR